jgi:hypothetical protein
MNFETYYLSERYTPDKNERFLSLITNVENWQKLIETIANAADRNDIQEDVEFLIKDPSKQFVIKLIYSNGNFTYSLDDSSVEWLERNKLTSEKDKMGFYYDKTKDALSLKRYGEDFVLSKNFKQGEQLKGFINTLYFMNKYSKVRNGYALIYYLEFVDNLSKNSAKEIKQDPLTPNWVKTVIKGDSSKREGGLFSLFKR